MLVSHSSRVPGSIIMATSHPSLKEANYQTLNMEMAEWIRPIVAKYVFFFCRILFNKNIYVERLYPWVIVLKSECCRLYSSFLAITC